MKLGQVRQLKNMGLTVKNTF